MHEAIINYIAKYSDIPISIEDQEILKTIWIPRRLKKKEFLFHQGQVCENATFIVKGSLRQYIIDKNGSENIMQLAIENWWITDRESFLNQTPSIYTVDAWEDTDVLQLPHEDFPKFQDIPAAKEMFWKITQNSHVASQKRINEAINLPAKERYESFIAQFPEFVQRFPQHLIASYLGISKETLSRIRKQIMLK